MLSNCIVSVSPVVHGCSVCHISWLACEGSLDCSGAAQRAVMAVAGQIGLWIFFLFVAVHFSGDSSVYIAFDYEFVEGGDYLKVRKLDAGEISFRTYGLPVLVVVACWFSMRISLRFIMWKLRGRVSQFGFCINVSFWFHIRCKVSVVSLISKIQSYSK